MSRVWDTSKYPPKTFVTLCQVKVIQCHEVKKGQIQNLGFKKGSEITFRDANNHSCILAVTIRQLNFISYLA